MSRRTYAATLMLFALGYVVLLLVLSANIIVGDTTDVVLMIVFGIMLTISLRTVIRAQHTMTGRDS